MPFRRQFLLILFLTLACDLRAEVYWPVPWRRGDGNAASFDAASLDGARVQMTEPVRWNGTATTLRVLLIDRTLDEILAELRARYKDAVIQPTPCGTMATFPPVAAWRLRLLLFPNADGRRVTGFELKLPVKSPLPAWPAELPPLPVGAVPAETISFEKSRSIYAAFKGDGDRALTLRYFANVLRGMDFQPMTGEAESPDGGRGELFLRLAPNRETLLISLDDAGGGTMLLRPAKR